jgi:hypothetical protein
VPINKKEEDDDDGFNGDDSAWKHEAWRQNNIMSKVVISSS